MKGRVKAVCIVTANQGTSCTNLMLLTKHYLSKTPRNVPHRLFNLQLKSFSSTCYNQKQTSTTQCPPQLHVSHLTPSAQDVQQQQHVHSEGQYPSMLFYFKNLLPEIFDESKRMIVEVVIKTFDEAALQAQGTIVKGNEMLITAHRE
jgi:hypothetical protein